MALVDPLNRELLRVSVPPAQAPVAAAGSPDGPVIVVLPQLVVRVFANEREQSALPDDLIPTQAAVDGQGREWLAATGQLHCRPADEKLFLPRWSKPEWTAPFRALLANDGMVVALTADGAIIEGRTSPQG